MGGTAKTSHLDRRAAGRKRHTGNDRGLLKPQRPPAVTQRKATPSNHSQSVLTGGQVHGWVSL